VDIRERYLKPWYQSDLESKVKEGHLNEIDQWLADGLTPQQIEQKLKDRKVEAESRKPKPSPGKPSPKPNPRADKSFLKSAQSPPPVAPKINQAGPPQRRREGRRRG
jgi:hypothetical protein